MDIEDRNAARWRAEAIDEERKNINHRQSVVDEERRLYNKQREDKQNDRKQQIRDDLFNLGIKIVDLKLSIAKGEITPEQGYEFAKDLVMMLARTGKLAECQKLNISFDFVWEKLSEIKQAGEKNIVKEGEVEERS